MTYFTLADLGMSAHVLSQIDTDELNTTSPARVSGVARDRLEVLSEDGPSHLTLPGGVTTGEFAVGDWVLRDAETGRFHRRLERQTLLQRRAAGTSAARQLIAANVDTLGIVTSCNADFNPARLERYVALASTAGCLPLVILTKADLADDPDNYRTAAERLSPMVAAVALDARAEDSLEALRPWTRAGQTVALVGSSGVGKTTLTNLLCGTGEETQDIREDDAKGRHTTTARALLRMQSGGWLIDTPGMRALRLTDAAEGIDAVFEDLTSLAAECRFADCAHEGEPGCAIGEAVANGDLDPDRVARWRKLLREDARNTETLSEARHRDRAMSRLYREGQARGRHKRGQ